jgi:hypothetical protein
MVVLTLWLALSAIGHLLFYDVNDYSIWLQETSFVLPSGASITFKKKGITLDELIHLLPKT